MGAPASGAPGHKTASRDALMSVPAGYDYVLAMPVRHWNRRAGSPDSCNEQKFGEESQVRRGGSQSRGRGRQAGTQSRSSSPSRARAGSSGSGGCAATLAKMSHVPESAGTTAGAAA
jgi:hypothetical protein